MALIPRTVDISSVMRDCEFLDNIQDEFKTDDRTEGATHVVLGDKKKTLKVLFGIAKGTKPNQIESNPPPPII